LFGIGLEKFLESIEKRAFFNNSFAHIARLRIFRVLDAASSLGL